jgi:hypothetical protein
VATTAAVAVVDVVEAVAVPPVARVTVVAGLALGKNNHGLPFYHH